jgi:leucyl aminopeptidase
MPHALTVIEHSKNVAIPIVALTKKTLGPWLKKQPSTVAKWLQASQFDAAPASHCLVPNKDGSLCTVLCGIGDTPDLWSLAHLPTKLPPGLYRLDSTFPKETATQFALGWALAGYAFDKYKKNAQKSPQLIAPAGCDFDYVRSMAQAIGWARDLINTPANDMTPQTLAQEAVAFAQSHKGKAHVIKGEDLLAANYPMIHAVGKASSVPPRLVDIRFGKKGAKLVTLVGKGVTFDSGGLDIKSASGMKMMKKDMGGAACVLALARVIVEMRLPVALRVLLPIVENAVAGNAMRPLDIVKTRKGITVEIGNTDAEGRLILCDALFEADEETPDLLIDCATLTGAARVALGTEIPAFFTNDDALADRLAAHSKKSSDPLWRLPLWAGYRGMLDTPNADLSNDPDSSYGGAITAALYLQEFVSRTASWLHIDMMAWNLSAKPGRPQGGEAMAVRALYAMIKERYGK